MALTTLAAMFFFTATGVPAQFPGSPAGNATASIKSPAPGQPSDSPEFEDKLTGDWRGLRPRLKQAGVSIDASLVLEGFKNFHGGISTTPIVGASTFDLSLGLDTEKLFNLKGGKFYVDLEDHAGRNPSQVLVGDLQIFDRLNSTPYLQVYELWYQQQLFDHKLRFKIGKVDANTEFSVIDNGLNFINSSTQVSPTIFLFPTTPDPMPSINVFVTPGEFSYASFGAYYSNRLERFGNLSGNPQNAQLSNNGAFLIGETGLKWRHAPLLKNGGNLKLGFWGHTGAFTRFDNSPQRGAYGYYAIFDQTMWQPAGEPENGRGVRMFLVYGRTQLSITPIYQHYGGGVAWTGLFPAHPKDVLGVSPQYAHLSPQAGLTYSYELALEAFYRLKIWRGTAFTPDLQYIIHPGGQYPNALVGTLRLEMNF